MRSFVRPGWLGLVILLVFGLSVARAAEAQPAWSPADVVALSEQLSAALEELLRDPGLRAPQTTAFQQRKHEAAVATLKRVGPAVDDLRKRIVAGSDLEGSRPYFEQVDEARAEIASYAEESWLPDATRTKVKNVRALFDRLASFYE